MDIEQILNLFFSKVPEMKELFEITCQVHGIGMADGPVAVWKVGIMECVGFLLNEAADFPDLTKRVFAFFEELANADKETRNFFGLTTMSFFYEEVEFQKKAIKFMGPKTKELWENYRLFEQSALLLLLSQLYSDEELEAMKQV